MTPAAISPNPISAPTSARRTPARGRSGRLPPGTPNRACTAADVARPNRSIGRKLWSWFTLVCFEDLQFPGSGWVGHDPLIAQRPEDYKPGRNNAIFN